MTTTPIGWPEAQRICDIPEVREALDKFAADAHEENMLAMVSAIMGHAVTQGRAAGLEEERALFEAWAHEFGFRDSERVPVHNYAENCARSAWLARATLPPTPSDAGKDDARDAARYRWLKNSKSADVDLYIKKMGAWKNYQGDFLDAAIDAALSSLEVIGKGEKG